MKSVAPDTPLGDLPRQCERLRERRRVVVKCGVEACDLREVGPPLRNGADRQQIVRLMQRSERYKLVEL